MMPGAAGQRDVGAGEDAVGPERSPGGKFSKKGSAGKKRRGSKSLALKDGKKGKRGSLRAGETGRDRHDEPAPELPVKEWKPKTMTEKKAARLKEDVKNRQGRARTFYELSAFCSVVLGLFLAHRSGALLNLATAAAASDMSRFYNFAAMLFGMSKALARSTFRWFYDRNGAGHVGGEILVNVSKRGRASKNYKLRDVRLLQPEHLSAIEAFILECHGEAGGGRVTLAAIRKHLRDTFKPEPPEEGWPEGKEVPGFDVSRDVIRYCLRHQLGYRWGKVRKKKRRDQDRPATLRSYLLRYSAALALERAGQAVIVYFDEVCNFLNACSFEFVL